MKNGPSGTFFTDLLIDASGKTLELRPGTLSSSFSLTLPVADGTANQYLLTNGSGALGWGTPSGTPVGTLITFAGSTCPSGYFAADGTAKSRTTYSALFSAISTTWGAGDGSTTFNLPDLRNRYVRGTGTNGDSNGGDTVALGAYQADAFAAHNHNGNGSNFVNVGGTNGIFASGANGTQNGSSANAGGNETRPKSYGVLYCIAYQ